MITQPVSVPVYESQVKQFNPEHGHAATNSNDLRRFIYERPPHKDGTMLQEHTELNRRAIHRAFEGWQQGTANIADTFASEMVWRIEGRSIASKEYPTKKAFVDEVLAPFAARFAGSREPFRPVRIRAVYADGDAVVVLWDGRGIARDGKPYENSYAWFLVMRDGRVVDGTAFFDASAFNDLWSRVESS